MMNLTPEERELGRENFKAALGLTRRDFLATAAAGIPAGAFYFGYKKIEGRPIRAGIIGTGDEGNILITESNPDYLEFIAYCDIRPSNRKRTMDGENNNARVGLKRKYGREAALRIEGRSRDYHDDYRRLLTDPEIEMVVIALPLHLHAQVSIEAMRAGKHVLCEKLMARTVDQCKEMVRVSQETRRLLIVGHQRHYSVLYDNAVSLLQSGVLGDIRHMRALWHRNNTYPMMRRNENGELVQVKDEQGRPVLRDSWRKAIPEEDIGIDYREHGYESLEELVRWRLYQRTGGGLMVELGSHQLDACSIFIARGLYRQDRAVHPVAVSGVGVKSFYDDDREVDDHIFATFEFPGSEYDKANNPDDVVVLTYSSINTNASENYGEIIYGDRGTMLVEGEKEVMLFKERDPNARGKPPTQTSVTVKQPGGQPVLDSSATLPSASPQASMAVATGQLSRGYREEMEHLAYLVKNYDEADYEAITGELRCNGQVGLADAVVALTSNIAMERRGRIEFREEWFDPNSEEVPEKAGELAGS